ncbi:potassium channel family protein [Streptomyces sp. NPDC050388]|uniref:potassium channel family protein n=1 Tax=Streptomyces sp. NPDC050388 TaxID=3155781 RepID=UPI0034473A93
MGSGRKPFTPRPPLWRWLVQTVGATLMVVAYFLLPLDGLGPQRPALSWTFFVLALALIAALLLQQIVHVLLNHPHARPGLVIPLLMCLAILVFATAYQALARQPGEMIGLSTRLDALYFTLVTLATIGYGDITPHGQTARLAAILQILYTFIFLTAAATALSRQLRTVFLHRGTDRHHHDPGA